MVEVDGPIEQLHPCHMTQEVLPVVVDKFIEHQIIHIHTHIMSMVILEVLHQELVVLLVTLDQIIVTKTDHHTMLSATS